MDVDQCMICREDILETNAWAILPFALRSGKIYSKSSQLQMMLRRRFASRERDLIRVGNELTKYPYWDG